MSNTDTKNTETQEHPEDTRVNSSDLLDEMRDGLGMSIAGFCKAQSAARRLRMWKTVDGIYKYLADLDECLRELDSSPDLCTESNPSNAK